METIHGTNWLYLSIKEVNHMNQKTHEKYSVAKKVISEEEINMENITDYIYDWDKEVKE